MGGQLPSPGQSLLRSPSWISVHYFPNSSIFQPADSICGRTVVVKRDEKMNLIFISGQENPTEGKAIKIFNCGLELY